MKTRSWFPVALTGASIFAAGVAQADVAIVDGIGGAVEMNSGSFGGIFGGGAQVFSNADLAAINAAVQSDGIITDGRVTFLLANTGAAGLSFIALIDDENQPGDFGGNDSILGMGSTAPDTASVWVNDEPDDIAIRVDLGNGTQLATGGFNWDSQTTGDGFAWGNLLLGDAVSFNFSDQGAAGLNGGETFQFLTFNGESWETIATAGFSNDNQFAFSFTTIPGPGVLAVIGLGGLIGARRRRTG